MSQLPKDSLLAFFFKKLRVLLFWLTRRQGPKNKLDFVLCLYCFLNYNPFSQYLNTDSDVRSGDAFINGVRSNSAYET